MRDKLFESLVRCSALVNGIFNDLIAYKSLSIFTIFGWLIKKAFNEQYELKENICFEERHNTEL